MRQASSNGGSHRLATVPEVAGDARSDLGNVPELLSLPSGASLQGLGNLRLHGSLKIATKLVTVHPGGGGNNKLSNGDPEDPYGWLHELLLTPDADGTDNHGTDLHFTHRYLFLYDLALVVADAVVELILPPPADESSKSESHPTLQCHFRHAIPIGQLSILVSHCLATFCC